ncbi:MAG: hypothetical protein ACTSX9_00730 [Candidatus Njordarchaeales archaeon]
MEQRELERIVIRSYSKIIVLLPSAIIAAILGLLQLYLGSTIDRFLGLIFMVILFFNILVAAFEFTEAKTFGFFALLIIAALSYLIMVQYNVIPALPASALLASLDITLSTQAYFAYSLIISIIVFLAWLSKRWDYWIIEPNQVTRRTGIFGKRERFPTHGMQYGIEIRDIFEYLLFGSGTLTLYFPSEKRIYVLPLVPKIKHVERAISMLLGIIEVEEEEV